MFSFLIIATFFGQKNAEMNAENAEIQEYEAVIIDNTNIEIWNMIIYATMELENDLSANQQLRKK